jgi:magnesium-transporting ATPase (P-type)
MGARRLRKSSAHGIHFLFHCLVNCAPLCAQILLLIDSLRKPLGHPPAGSNLALAVLLLLVLILQAVFNAWQDFSTSRILASVKGMLPSDVLVLRNSLPTKVAAKDIVPGDLITITMGEKVPADLRLIEVSADLQFDRSILTGEVSHDLCRFGVEMAHFLSHSE